MKRLFISLPDPLPDSLDSIPWRLPGGQPEHGQAISAADLPPQEGSRIHKPPETATTPLPAADEIWLVLPAGRVLLSSIKLSRRALRQLNGALGNALEDQLMLDPANVHVALGKALPDDVHSVAAVEIAWFEQVLALCQRHGIQLAGAIPETLLWFGEESPGLWSARWTGHDGFVRSGACAGFALDDGTADMPPLALQLALAEARRQVESPTAIVLEAEANVDAAAWSRVLDCPVRLQTLHPDPHAPAINLLQGRFAPRRRGWLASLASGQHAGKYRLAAGLAVAALAVHVLGTVADWARLSWENRQLRDEMRQVYKATFPQTQAIVDPSLQMQRQLANMRRARGYAETGDFLHILTIVGGQAGGVAGLSYEGGRLTLDQPRAPNLEGLIGALAAQGYQMVAASDEGNSRNVTIERSRP